MNSAAVDGLDPGVARGLAAVERLVRLEIARLRATGVTAGHDEYRGLYISGEEVTQLRAAPTPNQDTATEAAIEAQMAQPRQGLTELANEDDGPLGRLT